ncbi:MAG: hypothetical protein IJC16_00240 [Rikenellaceae bacterium]|nr:hypothetical protein [Rikenellaceae bacterium]
MNKLFKCFVFLVLFLLLVCSIGGIGTLYYVSVPGSTFFASGLIPVVVYAFAKVWPRIRDWLMS